MQSYHQGRDVADHSIKVTSLRYHCLVFVPPISETQIAKSKILLKLGEVMMYNCKSVLESCITILNKTVPQTVHFLPVWVCPEENIRININGLFSTLFSGINVETLRESTNSPEYNIDINVTDSRL